MREELTTALQRDISAIGQKTFITALFDQMSVGQLRQMRKLVDVISPDRQLLRQAADALVSMGVLPNEANTVAEIAADRVGLKDAGKFMFTCFVVNNERKNNREAEVETKPE